jgi:hypothetical protein
MADVKAFPGVTRSDLVAAAQPSPIVIQFLKDLLYEAERGEIQAIAVAYVRPDDVVGEGWQQSQASTSHQLFAAIHDLAQSFAKRRCEHNVKRPLGPDERGDGGKEPA